MQGAIVHVRRHQLFKNADKNLGGIDKHANRAETEHLQFGKSDCLFAKRSTLLQFGRMASSNKSSDYSDISIVFLHFILKLHSL